MHRKGHPRTTWLLAAGMAIVGTCLTVIAAHMPAPDAASPGRIEVASATLAPVEEPAISAADLAAFAKTRPLHLRSQIALVLDEREGLALFESHADQPRPIASITKLMTALVVLEASLPLSEPVEITRDDRDRIKGTRSRLHYGTVLTRSQLLRAALAASDNRAAAALARTYPGGTEAAIAAMNTRAQSLGMTNTRFVDAAGLSAGNVSTARDLVQLITTARRHPLIAQLSTSGDFSVVDYHTNRVISFLNTNRLVRGEEWDIQLSKTGYTADAGNCLVMNTQIAGRPMIIVLLNSWGKLTKYGDAGRIRDWLNKAEEQALRMTAQTKTTSL